MWGDGSGCRSWSPLIKLVGAAYQKLRVFDGDMDGRRTGEEWLHHGQSRLKHNLAPNSSGGQLGGSNDAKDSRSPKPWSSQRRSGDGMVLVVDCKIEK